MMEMMEEGDKERVGSKTGWKGFIYSLTRWLGSFARSGCRSAIEACGTDVAKDLPYSNDVAGEDRDTRVCGFTCEGKVGTDDRLRDPVMH